MPHSQAWALLPFSFMKITRFVSSTRRCSVLKLWFFMKYGCLVFWEPCLNFSHRLNLRQLRSSPTEVSFVQGFFPSSSNWRPLFFHLTLLQEGVFSIFFFFIGPGTIPGPLFSLTTGIERCHDFRLGLLFRFFYKKKDSSLLRCHSPISVFFGVTLHIVSAFSTYLDLITLFTLSSCVRPSQNVGCAR